MNRDEYYIALKDNSAYLQHHGIQGQKWGVRRYQYEDGTLTPEGKERYGRAIDELKNIQERASKESFMKKSERAHSIGTNAAKGAGAGALSGALGGTIFGLMLNSNPLTVAVSALGGLAGGATGGAAGGAVRGAISKSTGMDKRAYKKAQKIIDKYADKNINGKELEELSMKAAKLDSKYATKSQRRLNYGEDLLLNYLGFYRLPTRVNGNVVRETRAEFKAEKEAAPRQKEN